MDIFCYLHDILFFDVNIVFFMLHAEALSSMYALSEKERERGGRRGELRAQRPDCSSSLSVRDNNEPFIYPANGP